MIVISIMSTETPLPTPFNPTFLKSTYPRTTWSACEHANNHPTPLLPDPRNLQTEPILKQVNLMQAARCTLTVPGQGLPPGGETGLGCSAHFRSGWHRWKELAGRWRLPPNLLPSPGGLCRERLPHLSKVRGSSTSRDVLAPQKVRAGRHLHIYLI